MDCPLPFDFETRLPVVAVLVSVLVTSAMTAPVLSIAVPAMVPRAATRPRAGEAARAIKQRQHKIGNSAPPKRTPAPPAQALARWIPENRKAWSARILRMTAQKRRERETVEGLPRTQRQLSAWYREPHRAMATQPQPVCPPAARIQPGHISSPPQKPRTRLQTTRLLTASGNAALKRLAHLPPRDNTLASVASQYKKQNESFCDTPAVA